MTNRNAFELSYVQRIILKISPFSGTKFDFPLRIKRQRNLAV